MSIFSRCLQAFTVALAIVTFIGEAEAQNKKKKKKKDAGPPPIKALLIAGGCCHDYPNQTQILTEGISQRAKVQWEIFLGFTSKDRELKIYQTEDWAEGYDIIVHNECYGGLTDVETVERIVKGHTKYKIPMVAIHCSMHSYRNAKTDVWRELLGVTSVKHEKHALEGLDIVNRASDHPAMKHFGATWKTPKGELYIIQKSWPNMTTLATAYGVQTKTDHPCIWTNEYKGCKVFGTTLGHHNETMLRDEYLDMVTRGVLWATDRLKDDGTPKEGYAGKGKERILLPSMMRELSPGPAPTPADPEKKPASIK